MAAATPPRARQRLAASAGGALLLALAAAAALLLGMLWPNTWQPAVSARQLSAGAPQLLLIAGQEIYMLWEDGAPLALSTRDPHGPYRGGCQDPRVRYDAASHHFIDPCGGSAYERDGSYVRGPSPRSLDRFAVRISAGQVEIDVSERLPGTSHI